MNRRSLSVGLAVLIVSSLAGVVPLPASAKTLGATYGEAEYVLSGSGACRTHAGSYDRSTGSLQPYMHVETCNGFSGQGDTVVRMGSRYTTNSGELLGSYSASSSVSWAAIGDLICDVSGGASGADMRLALQKWVMSGSTWSLEEQLNIVSWSCVEGSFSNGVYWYYVTESGTSLTAFTFNPGKTYRLMLSADAHALAGGGPGASGTSNFCDSCSTGSDPDFEVSLDGFAIANQGPMARFNDKDVWYPLALAGVQASGLGCDAEGYVASVVVTIAGGSSTTAGSTACRTGTRTFIPAQPGTYPGWANATDDESAIGADPGQVNVSLIPRAPSSVSGFPNLGSIPEVGLGPTVTIETYVTPSGTVAAYRVSSGSIVYMDTMGSYVPNAADDFVVVQYDRAFLGAELEINGVTEWSGLVTRSGEMWWHFKPATDLVPPDPPNIPPAPDVVFLPLDSAPVQGSIPTSESWNVSYP